MSRLKATKRLISAISALVASLILCIGVCLAWFASNSKVDADGLNTNVKSTNIKEFKVTAYPLSDRQISGETTAYTVGATPLTEMKPYGGFEGGITALLIKLECTFIEDLGKNYEIGAEFLNNIADSVIASSEADYDLECDLSEVVEYFSATVSGTTATLGAKMAVAENAQKLTLNGAPVGDGANATVTVYCIVDYGELLIQNKYTYALNHIAGCSLNSKMKFENDVTFYVEETTVS